MAKRRFTSEDEERDFWSKQDATELADWTKAQAVTLPNLKPSLRTISLRLPSFMLDDLKRLAHKKDVPYQSLIKVFLADRLDSEQKKDADADAASA